MARAKEKKRESITERRYPRTVRNALMALAVLYPGDALLDLCCADGAVLSAVEKRTRGGVAVAGVCRTPEHTRQMREVLPEADLLYAEPDELLWGTDTMDVALCMPDVAFCRVLRSSLAQAYRVLRPGGQLLLALRWRPPSVPTEKREDEIWKMPTAQQFQGLMKHAGFRQVQQVPAGWGWKILIGWKAER